MMASSSTSSKKSNEKKSLVMASLSHAFDPTVSVALSEGTPLNPIPPDTKKIPKAKPSDLLVPTDKKRNSSGDYSDDSPSPTSPTKSKRWSPLSRKKKLKVRSGENQIKSANSSPDQLEFKVSNSRQSRSVPHLALNATPVTSLPGRKTSEVANPTANTTEVMLPTILVSPDEDGDLSLRKTSQSSHLSATTVTSGADNSVGSLLSPSGDEESVSDQESPLSPLSHSSIGSSREDMGLLEEDTLSSSPPHTDDGETDYIDPDFPTSPSRFPTNVPQALAIPSLSKNGKQKKKKWAVIKKAVAWSPFIQVYRKKYPWVQLAGHQGNFRPGDENGTIIKKSSPDEARALQLLMDDAARPFVPEFRRQFTENSELYVEMADLLREFDNPCVMDIKMGTRTYLEEELVKAKVKEALRPDMYEKMIAVDPNEPTEAEHAAKAITKPRYMIWRETLSSTATLGFRIEGIKMSKDKPLKEEFKTVRCKEDVKHHLKKFVKKSETRKKLLEELIKIRSALEKSVFFTQHEVVGSSLLFVYDSHNQVTVNIIDFGKTIHLPDGMTIDHRSHWEEGNHEDGYLFGLDNLIEIWEELTYN